MEKIKVLQQYVDAGDIGGLKTEYQSLCARQALSDKYEFIPMVLEDCHDGISLKDIGFYYRKCRQVKPDIIHIRGAGVESLNAVLGAKLSGYGCILTTVHGMFSDLVYYNAIKRWICRNIIEKMIFTLSDGISCVCKATEQRKIFQPYRHKMLPYIYNRMPSFSPSDESEKKKIRKRLALPESAQIGVYIGRVTKEKGLSYLADALEILDQQWPERFGIMIVGDGEYLAEMKKRCSGLMHKEDVLFWGRQSKVEEYLKASDFFIQPSLHENLSIALLEACAAKLPCLATNVGGNQEIIADGTIGLIIPSQSSTKIAEGIRRLCRIDQRSILKHNMESYDFSSFSDRTADMRIDQVYMQLLKNKELTN